MQKVKILLLVLVLVTLIGSLAAPASADCSIMGRVLYSTTTGAQVTVYMSTQALPAYYFTFTTYNPLFLSVIAAAQSTGRYIKIFGNAPSCPTSGTIRSGGSIIQADLL